SPATAIPDTDALLTQDTGVVLMALSADCPLLLCYDPVKNVIGTIHASWKGMIRGIIPKTINEMKQRFKSEPRDIMVGIAPSIGPCCYEVKNDFIKRMNEYHVLTKGFIQERNNKTYFDLWSMAYNELIRAGLKPGHIEVARMCTSCQPDYFYSYRRTGGNTGRFCALIYTKYIKDETNSCS
ncbi:peptidoglycan editing factor PgeF, partial [Planctomycetota bacterium]